MDEHFQWGFDLNQIELQSFLDYCNQLSAENYRIQRHISLIQERLAELETRAKELTEKLRTETH